MMLYKHHFGKKIYWDEKYEDNFGQFEWYHSYKSIRDIVTQYVSNRREAKVLYPGCGTSKLPEDMYNDGFRNIVSVDSSAKIIEEMRKKFNESMPKTFLFLKMNVLNMDFGNNIFSHVIDKGMLDSLASGYRSSEQVHTYLSEVYRVLVDTGIFFCLSYREPSDRSRFLDSYDWDIKIHKIYRPRYKTELRYIKEEYMAKKVIQEIEQEMDVKLEEKDFNYDDQDNLILKNIINEEQAKKEQRDQDRISLKPKEVESYYLYVCVKGEAKKAAVVEEVQLDMDEPSATSQVGGEEVDMEGEEEVENEQNHESGDGTISEQDEN